MAEEAAVILSAIDKLDSWLQLKKKAEIRDDDHTEKLSGLMLEKTPDMCSVVVGMADLWEHDREKLYSLLVRVADPGKKGTIQEEENVKENMYGLLVEMTDLWENDRGNKEKLHSLLLEMANPLVVFNEKMFSLVVEMVDLWEVSKGKVSKEKLNSWLANKTVHLWEGDHNKEKLCRLLHGITVSRGDKEEMEFHAEIWESVEKARNVLSDVIVEMEGQHHDYYYFISDVVEMALDAQLFVHVMNSDPFILFLQSFNFFIKERNEFVVHPLGKLLARIMSIQEGLQETRKRMLELGDELVMDPTPISTPTPTHSDHHVVGLEKDVELLLRVRNGIIYIGGMGGVGKTTLARELYNHPTIVDGFQCRAWVCLSSRELSRKEILIKLISQLADDVDDHMLMEKMDNKSLRQMLHQHLQGRPYFIVLDDMSSDIYFEYVAQSLPQDEGSRLLFTTRSPDLRCNTYFQPYNHYMKKLDEDKSWQLLLKSAMCDEEFPKQLEKKGRQMLMRKCGGLPLAIKEVGRQWAEKRQSGSEWEQVVESSMDLALSATLVALESTYLNLYPQAKSCFLLLGCFKEGTTIRANKLLQIWNAGGLLDDQEECEAVLYKLTTESILEVQYMPYPFNEEKKYRINVVFHRLSITKAEDEIGFEILGKDANNINQASHEPRHRVINCSRDNQFNYSYSSMNQDEHLVSLFLHGGGGGGGGGFSDICWNHFKRLEILDMEGFGLKILPEAVAELTKLIYLGLRNNCIQELSHLLGLLKKLEVLDIAQNFMVEVPDILWEMDLLRHLYMSDIICQKPLKIDALMNLETLAYISIDDWTYEVSDMKNKMTSLRKLGIEEVDWNSNISKLFASLAVLEKLGCLILRGFRFRSMPSLDELGLLHNLSELKLEGRLTRLPSATNFPLHLRKLVLVNCCLDEDPMPILEKLPNLEWLSLKNAYTGQQMVISPQGFLSLVYLLIAELWHLEDLQVAKGALPNLYQLEINSCPYLDNLPGEIICSLINDQMELKMVTSKNIATKIRELGFISRINNADIQP